MQKYEWQVCRLSEKPFQTTILKMLEDIYIHILILIVTGIILPNIVLSSTTDIWAQMTTSVTKPATTAPPPGGLDSSWNPCIVESKETRRIKRGTTMCSSPEVIAWKDSKHYESILFHNNKMVKPTARLGLGHTLTLKECPTRQFGFESSGYSIKSQNLTIVTFSLLALDIDLPDLKQGQEKIKNKLNNLLNSTNPNVLKNRSFSLWVGDICKLMEFRGGVFPEENEACARYAKIYDIKELVFRQDDVAGIRYDDNMKDGAYEEENCFHIDIKTKIPTPLDERDYKNGKYQNIIDINEILSLACSKKFHDLKRKGINLDTFEKDELNVEVVVPRNIDDSYMIFSFSEKHIYSLIPPNVEKQEEFKCNRIYIRKNPNIKRFSKLFFRAIFYREEVKKALGKGYIRMYFKEDKSERTEKLFLSLQGFENLPTNKDQEFVLPINGVDEIIYEYRYLNISTNDEKFLKVVPFYFKVTLNFKQYDAPKAFVEVNSEYGNRVPIDTPIIVKCKKPYVAVLQKDEPVKNAINPDYPEIVVVQHKKQKFRDKIEGSKKSFGLCARLEWNVCTITATAIAVMAVPSILTMILKRFGLFQPHVIRPESPSEKQTTDNSDDDEDF